jgi:hypothetical protein
MGNGEEERFLADNKSLIGLGLFVVLCLFGAICTIREFIRPSEHMSVSESLRLLGEAVESEYGILSAAEDSTALDSTLIDTDNPTDEP